MSPRAASIVFAAFTMGILGGRGAAAADPQPAKPLEGPWDNYFAYLRATRGGDVEPYLTDEGRVQWRAFSPEARKAAAGFLYSLPGLQDAKLLDSKVEGNRAHLDAILYFDPMGAGTKDEVKAHVELVRSDRGWGIRSETFTPPASIGFYGDELKKAGWTAAAGGAWGGLQAPGVFPPAVQARADAVLRDRSEGDKWAIGDVRTVISAQAAYQSANNGYYDRIECLIGPTKCIPGFPANGPVFLDARLGAPRNGYRPRFDPGPRGEAGPQASKSSMVSYAYWMIPEPGRAGRTICGDASGIICTMTGAPAPATKGECPIEPGPCAILR